MSIPASEIRSAKTVLFSGRLLVALALAATTVTAAAVKTPKASKAPETPLTETGNRLLAKYEAMEKASRMEIEKALPRLNEQKKDAFLKAREAFKAAEAGADTAAQPLSKIQAAKGLVEHAKGKWIGDAEKGIKKAQAALKAATTEAEKEAANKDLAKWQANKEDGIKALKERQADLDKLVADEAKSKESAQSAQSALAQVQANDRRASSALLEDLKPVLASDKLDSLLVKGAVLAQATPRGLAEFAQQGKEQEALVDKLLADNGLMKQMLEAGGAKFGKYGRAMEIYSAIQKTSAKAKDGNMQRLALATGLEHAKPVAQTNPEASTNQPATVDPLKRYQHYEKAYLDGELDPAFKNFTVWEYRQVIDSDAPDSILAWGREMLRNYRPDHIYNPNYGWRYSAAVKTEVPYGSQNEQYDRKTLQKYQNIVKDGGVCGRRAFFGRFILQSFGIPTWGVTQFKHAALSHWTPNGWLINLGAGFNKSWWDKDETSRSGLDFLLESQARAVPQEYLKVLRAQWVSSVLGEQAYNDRKGIDGGFWSLLAHYQAQAVATAAKAVDLGPLGQELSEANEPKSKEKVEQVTPAEAERKLGVAQNGVITIPSVAHGKASGHSMAVKSFAGGMQMHCSGGFKTEYAIEAPRAGKYAVTARVVTIQEGQKFQFAANDAKVPVEIAVPYTIGKWAQTPPAELALVSGKNVIHFALREESNGVAIKEFTLTPLN